MSENENLESLSAPEPEEVKLEWREATYAEKVDVLIKGQMTTFVAQRNGDLYINGAMVSKAFDCDAAKQLAERLAAVLATGEGK